MKRLYTTGLLLCSLFLTASVVHAQDLGGAAEPMPITIDNVVVSGDAPALLVQDHVWRFGKAAQGVVLEQKFEIRNVGKGDLRLMKVEPDCGCLVVDYPRDPIPSGEKGAITLKFLTNGRLGAQFKRVNITTNEPTKKAHFLEIQGEILAPQATETPKKAATPDKK